MLDAIHYRKAATGPISFVTVGLLLGRNLSFYQLGGCRTEVRCEVQGVGFIDKHVEIVGEWLGELYSTSDSLIALLWSAARSRIGHC